MPSNASGIPKVRREEPVCKSKPIRPIESPKVRAIKPRRMDWPSTAPTVPNAKTISAKKSAGVIRMPIQAIVGDATATIPVAIAPATNEPMAAVASAALALPFRAILLPSMVVITEPDSPGAFKRIEVVEPPNIAP